MWRIEPATSGRSKCRKCKRVIKQGMYRIGETRFVPYPATCWYHVGCAPSRILSTSLEKVQGLKHAPPLTLAALATIDVPKIMPAIVGPINLQRFASSITERYGKFRSFTFGVKERYSREWNRRCFLATILVCNTKESDMLLFTKALFKLYPDAASLYKVTGDEEDSLLQLMKSFKIRHAKKKVRYLLDANKNIVDRHSGEVPESRKELEAMRGVGRHVSSVTMAWVHEKGEFGIDVHVTRILKRWHFFHPSVSDREIEVEVKKAVPAKKIGHFSRSFVDHGQSVCGFVPECDSCYLKHSCPSADKTLEW